MDIDIKKLRKEKGMTQADLAESIGVTKPTVSAWENGRWSPAPAQWKALKDLLLDGQQPTAIVNAEPSKGRRIPVYGYIPAGIPLEAITEIKGYEEISPDMQGNYFGLTVHGDSMSPKYLDGDTIIVKAQKTFDNGQDCVVQVNGFDATLKKVYVKEDCFELVPINKGYEPMQFKEIDVRGVVVELRRKI